jgi:hypothetical protein
VFQNRTSFSSKTLAVIMKKILVVIFILTFRPSFGQIDSTKAQIPSVSFLKGIGGFMFGGHFIGKTICAEIGFVKSNVTKVKDYRADIRNDSLKEHFYSQFPHSLVGVASELFLLPENQIGLGPKIGYEYCGLLFKGKIYTTLYTDFKGKVDFRISPSLGLNLFLGNIVYNFNYPLLNSRFSNISIHRISVFIYLDRKQ